MQFANFFNGFDNDKVQVIGKQENDYLLSLDGDERILVIEKYIKQNPVCIVFTRGLDIPEHFKVLCEEREVPLLLSEEKTSKFVSKLVNFLEKELSEEIGIHGVCLNVFGVGIIVRGESGIGKSELALSLIERGHRLISDDLVKLKKIGPVALIGSHNELNKHFLALRGIGLVNVLKMYGSGSVQDETKINLDIVLTSWDGKKYYDAIYVPEKHTSYMGINVEHLEIPIKPGKDIASLIEVAAKNWRLKQDGYNPVEEFNERIKTEKPSE